jgi:putative NADH-flavin reductase
MRKVLVTGGGGYKGCILVPKLLKAGYFVVVYDLMLFGDKGLPKHPNLSVVKGDIRDITSYSKALKGCDSVIHMACISNDPSFDLDPSLSRTINYECFEPMVVASKKAGIKRFIYVSTSSVYGVSDAPEVAEDHPFVPLTDYNKYKGMCEPLLLKHQSPGFVTVIIRPATVCGYSSRMRFDLTVNILTNLAVPKGWEYQGITLNHNVKAKKHIDKKNVGPSVIVGLGDYSGGEIRVWDKDGQNPRDFPLKDKPLMFNGGLLAHETQPFTNPSPYEKEEVATLSCSISKTDVPRKVASVSVLELMRNRLPPLAP